MKHLFIRNVFVCVLSLFFIFQLKGQQRVIDSLENILSQRKQTDTVYIDVLNQLAFEYLKVDPAIGLDIINESLLKADSLQYQRGIFRALMNKGNGFWVSGLFDQALKYYLTALNIADTEDRLGYIKLYNNIGEVYRKQAQYDSAFSYYFRSFNLARQYLNTDIMSDISMVSSNIAETHLQLGNRDSAEYYYNKTYEYSLTEGSPRGMSYALFGLGEIQYSKGDVDEAISYHEKSLSVRREISEVRAIIQSMIRLSDLYQEISYFRKAGILLNEAEELSNGVSAYDLLSQSYYSKAVYLESIGNHASANEYLFLYLNLKDSLEAQATVDRINNIQSSLESELNATENQLLKEERKQQQLYLTYQVIIIIGITFVILILSLFLFQYYKRLKLQKINNSKLDRLNQIILTKNSQIEDINRSLDHRLISTSQMLQESQKVAKLGGWEYDVLSEEMKWTDEVYNILEMEPGSVQPTVSFLKNFIDSKSYNELKNSIEFMNSTKREQLLRFDLLTSHGIHKTVSVKLIPQIQGDRIHRVFGTVMDITERIKNEKKQREIQQTLLELSKSTNLKKITFKEFIEDLLYKASNVVNVSRVSFWQYSEDSKSISCFRAYKGGEFIKEKHIHYVHDLPIYFKALNENRTIAASDAFNDPRTQEFTTGYFQNNNIKSLLDAQVQLEGKFLGIISFEKTETIRQWNFSDQRFVGSLADIIATAYSSYENKRLVIEKEKLIETLVRKNQNLREFAYVISHNLREPAAQIMGLSDLLSHNDIDEKTREEVVQHIMEGTLKLDMVIKDLSMVLSSQEGKEKRYRNVLLKDIIEKTRWVLSDEIKKIKPHISMDYDRKMELEGPLDYYSNMIYNLFSNALKYRKTDNRLEIKISAEKNEEGIVISFSDNGKGIDLETYGNKIFKMYQRFHMDIDGRGIGLYIVKKQIEQLGGQIEVKSQPGEGTTFTISLPFQHARSMATQEVF